MIRHSKQYDEQTHKVHTLKYEQSDWRFQWSFNGNQNSGDRLGLCQRQWLQVEYERTHVARISKFATKMSCTTIASNG